MKRPSKQRALKELEPMVRRFASQWVRQHHGLYEDLVQQGFMGVLEAHKRYKESANTKFSSYAWFYIRKHIREYTMEQWNVMNNTTSSDNETNTWLIDQQNSVSINEDAVDINIKVSKLDDKDKAIFLMKQEGYTLDEISKALKKHKLTKSTHSLESIRVQLNKINKNLVN